MPRYQEINSTINGSIATLRVFFNLLVEEEYLSEHENPMRRVKNLKEDKKVILTFNDEEVSRILNDVEEAILEMSFLLDSGISPSISEIEGL